MYTFHFTIAIGPVSRRLQPDVGQALSLSLVGRVCRIRSRTRRSSPRISAPTREAPAAPHWLAQHLARAERKERQVTDRDMTTTGWVERTSGRLPSGSPGGGCA